jgi:hypothetical protein
MNEWLGFLMASLYYFSLEGDFGKELCDILDYGYLVTDELHVMTSWSKQEKPDLTQVVSFDVKDAAKEAAKLAEEKAQ